MMAAPLRQEAQKAGVQILKDVESPSILSQRQQAENQRRSSRTIDDGCAIAAEVMCVHVETPSV